MSDEQPRPASGTDAEPVRPRNVGGLFEHYCGHPGCSKWGGWGFPGRMPGTTLWFCFEHRPE